MKSGGEEMEEDDYVSSLGDITKLKADITYNNNRTYPNGKKAPDGIEIRFGTARPTAEVREIMKAHGFQFSEKQTMWYALDNDKSRELAKYLSETEVDVDTTQYEKRNFWVRVKSVNDFDQLRERTEFYVKTEPPKYFYSKSFLKKAYPSIASLIGDQVLSYKKYYNKVVGEEDESDPQNRPPQPSTIGKQVNLELAAKLKALADGMQKQIDAKLNPAIANQRPTKKRMRVAEGMRSDGYALQEIQTTLYALADANKTGTIVQFPFLKAIQTRTQVELIKRYEFSKDHFKNSKDGLLKLNITSEAEWRSAHEQLSVLKESYMPLAIKQQNENERRIRELEVQAFEAQIPGFFPTPSDLIDDLLKLADIQPNDRVLEPSAGKGDILDAVSEAHYQSELHAVEQHSTLREILSLKGYNLVGTDFLEYQPNEKYDKIIMNPPFESGQDIEHVRHAFSLVERTGRVVAIMGEGAFFRQFKKDKAFREFLKEKNAYVSLPIKEAFKKAFNSTSTTVRIVAINGDGSHIDAKASSKANVTSSDEIEILEIEAEAELELLKLRVELERKKGRPLSGFAIDQNELKRFVQKAWSMQERWEVMNYK